MWAPKLDYIYFFFWSQINSLTLKSGSCWSFHQPSQMLTITLGQTTSFHSKIWKIKKIIIKKICIWGCGGFQPRLPNLVAIFDDW